MSKRVLLHHKLKTISRAFQRSYTFRCFFSPSANYAAKCFLSFSFIFLLCFFFLESSFLIWELVNISISNSSSSSTSFSTQTNPPWLSLHNQLSFGSSVFSSFLHFSLFYSPVFVILGNTVKGDGSL